MSIERGSDLTDRRRYCQSIADRVPGYGSRYFAGQNFLKFIGRGMELDLNFNWGTGSPAPGVPINYFSCSLCNTNLLRLTQMGERNYDVIIDSRRCVRVIFDGKPYYQ